MKKVENEIELATKTTKLYPRTHARLKKICVRANAVKRKGIKRLTIAELVERSIPDWEKMR